MAHDLLYFMSILCAFAAESPQGHQFLRESPSRWGSRRQDFSCVAGAGRGPLSAVLRQPFKPFQLHLHLCLIRAAEATAVTQWLFVSSSLAILLPGNENFSLSSPH